MTMTAFKILKIKSLHLICCAFQNPRNIFCVKSSWLQAHLADIHSVNIFFNDKICIQVQQFLFLFSITPLRFFYVCTE